VSDRDDARRLLRELLPEVLGEVLAPVPTVPAPPVAAVMRPSTWDRPPAPGEVIGDGTSAAEPTDEGPGGGEPVTLDSDEDLDRFVRALAARLENPRERMAIRSGALRFTLRRGAVAGPARDARRASPALRVERGAVTERRVAEAAATGARLVLAPGAVLTPLGRDKARALGVNIERES
jgi:hypothetical protein